MPMLGFSNDWIPDAAFWIDMTAYE